MTKKPNMLGVLLTITVSLILFLFFATKQALAVCYRISEDGCPNSKGVVCSNDNAFCCETQTECSARAFATDCDPGAGGVPLGSCLLLSDSSKVQDVYTSPAFLVNLIVDNVFVAAGVIIFFLTLLAGFLFVTGGKKGLDQARQILLAVVVGFGLMIAAYWIVQIVKILTGADILI